MLEASVYTGLVEVHMSLLSVRITGDPCNIFHMQIKAGKGSEVDIPCRVHVTTAIFLLRGKHDVPDGHVCSFARPLRLALPAEELHSTHPRELADH
jgi:hypothetical protein